MDRTTSTAFTVTRQSLLQCAKAAYCCFNTCEQQRRTGEYGSLFVYCINERVIRASLSFERKNVEIEVKLRWAAYQIVCIYGVTAILAREYAYTPCWIAGWHSELIASSYVFDTFFCSNAFVSFFFSFSKIHTTKFSFDGFRKIFIICKEQRVLIWSCSIWFLLTFESLSVFLANIFSSNLTFFKVVFHWNGAEYVLFLFGILIASVASSEFIEIEGKNIKNKKFI